ncbi:hypothetical protein [Prosthecobacter sp.]|uniref:hypothetical protein n=1 Tax=Prosthecobacter sp. TaxID=1965333 RepID=UPI003784957D
MDRFKSVLVEGKGELLRTTAAYIDLNPVRAGLVQDPKDYRWCAYAEALGGSRRAQRGLCKALGKPVDGWRSARAAGAYRCLLHDEGREVKDAQNENVVRRGVTLESTRAVLAEKGRLSPAELLRLRVRYFTDGVVLGSQEFVEGIFEAQRELFSPKRKKGARRLSTRCGGCVRGLWVDASAGRSVMGRLLGRRCVELTRSKGGELSRGPADGAC